MKKTGLKNFIEDYVRKNLTAKKQSGYAAWLRENGIDPTSTLADEIGKAYAKSERSLSKNGTAAEALAESGLSGSGYAGYLKEMVEKKRSSDVKGALDDYLNTASKSQSSYADYAAKLEAQRAAEEKKEAEAKAKEEAKKEAERIKAEEKAEKERIKAEQKAEAERKKAEEKAEKEAKAAAEKLAKEAAKAEAEKKKKEEQMMEKLYKETKSAIESSKMTSYDEAYDYAIKKGLDESTASELAKTTTDAIRTAAQNKVIDAIISRYMTENQAKQYALKLGLSEEDAKVLAEFAFTVNQSTSDIVNEDYLNDLREQIKNNKKG